MNKFLFKLLQLSIIPALVLFLLGLRQEQDRIVTLKRQLFERYKGSVQCLITGTSHTLNGINPTLLPMRSLNIAEDAKALQIDIELIEKYLDQLPQLKYVIIPVDYITFYFTGLREGSAAKHYHHWHLKDGFIKSYFFKRYHVFTCGFKLSEFNTFDQYDTILGYRAEFGDLSKASRSYRLHKYQRKIIDWNRYWIDTGSTRQIYTRCLDFICMLQKRGIQTILVTMPVCKQFYRYLDPKLLNRNTQLIDSILHNTNAKYIDLQNNRLLAADSLFFNIDHLNDKGATIATAIIKDALCTPHKTQNHSYAYHW
jgi:hypothetical protein